MRRINYFLILCCLLLWQFTAIAGSDPDFATGISLNCPSNITVQAQSGANGASVSWNTPNPTTGCSTTQTNCNALSNSANGFTYMGNYDGSKYWCSTTNNYDWHEAKNLATSRGGYLLTVSSSGENNYIKSNLIASHAWIGYNDAASEGNFVWQSGANSSYTNWASGEPNNYNNSDYVVMVKSDGKWKDRQGHDHYEVVMEKRCPVTTTPGVVTLNQTAGLSSGSYFPVGTTTVTYSATDNCGNVASCSFTVTVISAPAPCAGQGGDSDGDGVCNNQDCQPNNPNFPATPGSSCNDGNPNTTNDMVTADGCGCAGTPVGPTCSITNNGCNITITGLSSGEYAKVFDANWDIIWDCNPWANGGCNSTETITVPSNGTYHVQACGETQTVTINGCTQVGPCDNAGGDSDGDGVCNNDDCQPNNPNFPATPGSFCNDGNPNTTNDMVTADGCGCAGTPVGPTCSVTSSGCDITITGLSNSDYSKVFDSNWDIIWDCNPWNGGCNSTETITVPSNGTYHVQACGETQTVTISGCTQVGPCDNAGGDSDGDGVCNNDDCQPNNPNFPATPGSSCNDGNPNTTNDMVTADGCGCAGTPVGPTCSVTNNGCNITITGLNNSDYTKVFDANWNIIFDCNPWSNGGCNSTEVITVPSNGTYHVQACGETQTVTISGCTQVGPCDNAGGDSDGDGVCNNDDCQPNNPNFPATPGSSCNDGNPNTTNDMVTADGCGCAGTPVGPTCSVTNNGCNITITGLNNSDYTKVFDVNWNIIFDCNPWSNGGCNSTEVITVPSNGTYHVQACGETTTVTITGCTPVGPCDNAGGDSDGDGVCNNDDCQPNNPNFPATPGSSCNDGNPNTTNDMVTADGCGCAGTPVGPTCSVTNNGCNITITGLNNSDYTKVFDANWNIIFDCNPWSNGGCNSTEVITVPSNGTYHVQACGETTTVTITGCTPVGPCDNAGGDSDGDGVCNNDDCQPNNPNFPATPGSSCNDGNSNTTNDMVTSDGCSCAGTPVQVCNPTRIAYWDLDACESFSSNGSNNDFSEFTAATNTPSGFSVVNASILSHDDGVHSCTEGQSGIAICSGIRNSCSFVANSNDAFKFSITVAPTNGGTATLTKLSFYEAAPYNFSHISGNSGDNDPPSHYGMRVLKNGQEIYRKTGRNTTENWTYEQFDLAADADFVFTGQTTFVFELLGYCRQTGTTGLAAWDLDEIKVFGCAGTPNYSITQQSEYLHFDAVKDGRNVVMNWVTNTDYKNDYFEVEHSKDGINFEILDEVMSISDSREYTNYQNRDENANQGINYYRLKQIYADRSYRYSEVREVSFDLDLKDFTVYPNPALDEINLSLAAYEGLSAEIMISNSLGKVMQSRSIDELTQAPVRIEMPNYQAGVYTVRIKLDGKRQMTKMFVISRL